MIDLLIHNNLVFKYNKYVNNYSLNMDISKKIIIYLNMIHKH